MGLGKTFTISADIQSNLVSLLVILRQKVTELCASIQAIPVLRTFVQYLIAFCGQPETAIDVNFNRFVGPIVHDKRVEFLDPRSNRSREIPPDAIRGVIFGHFSNLNQLPNGSS